MILTSLFALAALDVLAYLDNLAALKRSNLQEALQNRAVSVRPMSPMHPVRPMRPMRATLKSPRTQFTGICDAVQEKKGTDSTFLYDCA